MVVDPKHTCSSACADDSACPVIKSYDRRTAKMEALEGCVGVVSLSLHWQECGVQTDAVRTAFEMLMEPENFVFLKNLVALEEWERAGDGWPK